MPRTTVGSALQYVEPLHPRWCVVCGACYRTDFLRCPNDGGELAVGADPLIRHSIGEHYVIDELIGQGAMGRVYRAHHALLAHKRYAVKVLYGEAAVSTTMRLRFANEAEAASRLDHPNIVSVVDFGRSPSGLLYLVMALVEGETLGRMLREGPLAPARVVRMARQLCEGLAHAHAHGVVHRDFKPDNILVAHGDRVRIADFGLAISTEGDDARLTTSGIVCTPAYAAPEQLAGGEIDHRADLYALGATLFEMLAGRMPFVGDANHIAARKLSGMAPSLAEVAPRVPAPLARLIGSLLEVDRARRPATARAVLARLDSFALAPTVRWQVPRRRARTSLPAALLAGLVFGSSVAWTPTPPPRVDAASVDLAATVDEPGQRCVLAVAESPAPRVVMRPPVHAAPPPATLHVRPPIHHATVPLAIAVATIPLPPPLPHWMPPARPALPVHPAAIAHAAPPAHPHEPKLVALDVQGSLPASVVRRAIERSLTSFAHCTHPALLRLHFTIDDSRRARPATTTARCVASALSTVRTEAAPDIGDAEIRAAIAF